MFAFLPCCFVHQWPSLDNGRPEEVDQNSKTFNYPLRNFSLTIIPALSLSFFCHLRLRFFPSLSKLFVSSFRIFTLSFHFLVLPYNLFPYFISALSGPAGRNHCAQSDAMVVIGCPLPQIRSQLALGVLWRLPITPTPQIRG